jgi:hypothetical protein
LNIADVKGINYSNKKAERFSSQDTKIKEEDEEKIYNAKESAMEIDFVYRGLYRSFVIILIKHFI